MEFQVGMQQRSDIVGMTGGNGEMTANSAHNTSTVTDSNGNVNRSGTPGVSTTYDSLERQLRSMSLQSNLNKLDTSMTGTNQAFGTPTDIAAPNAVYGSTIGNHRNLLRENAPLSRSSTLIETMNMQQSPIGQQTQFATSTMSAHQQQVGPAPQRNGSLFNYLMGSSHTPVQQQSNPLEMNHHQALLGGLRTNGDVGSMFNSPGSVLTTHTPVSVTTPVQAVASSPFNPTVMGPSANNYMPVMVTSQWRYIDHQGQIQGPFQTPNMSMWYMNNYFQPSLQISRVGTSFEPFGINDKFISLSELISRVNNSADPFAAFDIMVSTLANNMLMANFRENGIQQQQQQLQQQQQTQKETSDNGSSNAAMGVTGPVTSVPKETVKKVAETSMSSTTGSAVSQVKDQHHTQSVMDQRSPIDIINEERKDRVPTADITASGDYTLDELFQMEFEDGSYYHEIIVPVPVNRKLVRKIDPSTVIEEDKEAKDPMLLDNKYLKSRESVEYTERMKEIAQLRAAKEAARKEAERLEQEKLAAKRKQDMLKEEELRRREKAELMAKKLLEEQERAEMEKKKREEMKMLKQQQQQKKQQKKQKQQQQQQQQEEEKLDDNKGKDSNGTLVGEEARAQSPDEDSSTDSATADSEKPTAKGPAAVITTPAPWATQQRPVKSIPLLEIKRQEDLKQRKLEEERERKARANLLKLNDQLLKEEREKQKMRSVLTWAEKSPTTTVPISLDLKSQLKKDKERSSSPAGSISSTTPSPLSSEPLKGEVTPSFIEEQMRIWEQVQRANKSKRQAEASNQWTTVKSKSSSSSSKTKSKGITQQQQLQQQQPTKQIGSSTSIPALKNRPLATPLLNSPKPKGTVTTSSLATAATPSYPGNASISLRQEFIKWCKSQLKLNPGISVTSVLEVLLSLPSGSESREIIADTIYSNSSTMDGRRFATEFIKRRTECEKKVKDPLSWNAVLAMPEGTDDDWEFQVVGKRKGKKHQN